MPISDPVASAKQGVDEIANDRNAYYDKIDRYMRGDHDFPYMPPTADEEYKLLARRSITNWLPLLVKTPAQALAVEGYRPRGADDSSDPVPEWVEWQRNRLDSRQNAVHRAALTYGQAYAVVLRREADPNQPLARGVSPRRMWAGYEDPGSDDFPVWALEVPQLPSSSTPVVGRLYDDHYVYHLEFSSASKAKILKRTEHHLGVCPVVRFATELDLEGRSCGVVWPMIPMQDRLNQTIFDLLVAQTFGSFKVRTVSGMAPPVQRDADGKPILDENGQPVPRKITANQARFLIAPDPDTRFGSLDETPLDGFISSADMSVRHLAAVSQTPPHYLLGSVVNLSAEALAAAEAALSRFVDELKHSFGESWELLLQLFSRVMGRPIHVDAQVMWKDAESRSLAQTVDALGKAAQMLEIPVEMLWSRIPGFTATDIEEMRRLREESSDAARMVDRMARRITERRMQDGA